MSGQAAADSIRDLVLMERTPRLQRVVMQCNNNTSNTPRPRINEEIAHALSPHVNAFPLNGTDYIRAAMGSMITLSPPGTGVDCFRHYEMLLAGTLVVRRGAEHPCAPCDNAWTICGLHTRLG